MIRTSKVQRVDAKIVQIRDKHQRKEKYSGVEQSREEVTKKVFCCVCSGKKMRGVKIKIKINLVGFWKRSSSKVLIVTLLLGLGMLIFDYESVTKTKTRSSTLVFDYSLLQKNNNKNDDRNISTPVIQGNPRALNQTTTTKLPQINNIYTCGYNRRDFFNRLFPEYADVPSIKLTRKSVQKHNLTKNHDIIVNGLGGFCDGLRKKLLGPDWMYENFPGNAIHINGESVNGKWWETTGNNNQSSWANQYHIGYVPDSNTSIQVTFLAQAFAENPRYWDTLMVHEKKPKNTKEAFMIYTASNCVDFREEAAGQFSEISQIHLGGKCKGNISNTTNNTLLRLRSSVPSPWRKIRIHKKTKNNQWPYNDYFYKRYRFCLVLENKNLDGYITEKILIAYQGGCIPIYYGTKQIFELFNERSFIYYDINNPQPALDKVKYLESNQTAYDEVLLNEKILKDGNATVNKFLSLDDMLGDGSLKQKIRNTIFPPPPLQQQPQR